MKRYSIGLLKVLLGLLLFASCSDEDEVIRKKDVVDGLPTTVKIDFTSGSLDKIETKAAIDGDIYDMYVIVFDKTGNNVITKKYFGQSDLGTGSISFDTTTGERLIYALANVKGTNDDANAIFTTGRGSVYSALETVGNVTDLKNLSVSLAENQRSVEFAEDRYLMSGVYGERTDTQAATSVTISEEGTLSPANNGTYKIWFTRLFSQIDFKIKAIDNITFIPTSWDIVNVPVQSNLYIADTDASGSYFSVRDNIAFKDNAFSFLMQENRKLPEKKCSNEEDREKGTGKDKDRTFENANSNSAYVILRGNYSDASYNGEVIYYIHLGNATMSNKDWDNFNTKRNKNYVYTVTIAGVNSIVTEVEVEDPYERADGDLTDLTTGELFEFDAPYEHKVLSFNESDLQGDKIVFQVKTPYTNNAFFKVSEASESDPYYEENWKWAYFLVNKREGNRYTTDPNRFPGFASEGVSNATTDGRKLMDIVEFYNFLKDERTRDLLVDGEIYVTCFVNEYKYKGRPWTEYVNKDNRVLQLFCNVKEGNHSSITSAKYVLSQQSICSFYSADNPNIGAWGIQRKLSETPLAYDNSIHIIPYSFEAMSTGYENMVKEFDLNSLQSWYADKNNGLDGTISYNDHFNKAYAACMQKNRDENGNGQIDQDEIKWYLPAINQYADVWLGTAALPATVHLYPNSYTEGYYLYSNSTAEGYSKQKNMLYAQQGSSFGRTGFKYGDTNPNKASLNYRCIRNFGERIDNYYTYVDNNGKGFHQFTLNQMDSKALRSNPVRGALDKHDHNSQINRPYKKFIVASNNAILKIRKETSSGRSYVIESKGWDAVTKPDDVHIWREVSRRSEYYVGISYYYYKTWEAYYDGKSPIKEILGNINDKTNPYNPCSAYSENGVTGWRFPNQRELALMIQIKNLVTIPTMSYTDYAYNPSQMFAYNGQMHLTDDKGNAAEYVRCVKDVE